MKISRLRLAVLSAVFLAACNGDPVGAPLTPAQGLARNTIPTDDFGATTQSTPAESCDGTLVVEYDALGNPTIICVPIMRGGQHGGGN